MRLLLAATLLLAFSTAPAQTTNAPATVRFETTMGTFVIELDTGRAPLSTMNFLQYVAEGHYDSTLIHRVIANFVVQGGGYTREGQEKPTRPPVPNESGNGFSNARGTVAMARREDPHSATSQFYINLADNAMLDPQPARWGYAVIGRVVEGMDVVDKIAVVATDEKAPFGPDVPVEPILILKAERVGPSPAER